VARTSGKGGRVRLRTGGGTLSEQMIFDRQNDPLRLPGSVSLDDFDITMEDIAAEMAERADYAEAASGGKGKLLKIPEPRISSKIALKIAQQLNSGGSPAPQLEVPADRVARANLAIKYYLSDGIAGPAIRSLYEFVIGPGFDIDPVYTWDELPGWFNVNAPEVGIARQRYIESLGTETDAEGKTKKKKTIGKKSDERDRLIFLEYLRLRAEELRDRLELEDFAIELARDGLVAGDGFGFRVDNIIDEKAFEDLQPKAEYLFNTVWEIQGVNPVAIELETDEFGTLVGATTKPAGDFSGKGNPVSTEDLPKLIHLKWNGNRYTTYGNSQLINALTELQLKESLMNAMKASADRYSLPIKLATYGVMAPGSDGGPIALDEWRDELISAMTAFNPQRDVLVGPFHWDIKYIGAEGDILDLAGDIEASNRRIMMSIGVPPNFLDSNYTSYNTAKIQVANMFLRLRQLQLKTGGAMERSILQPWAQMRGYRDVIGNVIPFKVNWRKANLEGDPEMLSTIRTLASVPTQEVMSVKTQRHLMGLNPDIEEQNFAAERLARRARFEEQGLDPNTGLPPGTDKSGNPVNEDNGTDNTDQNDSSQNKKKDSGDSAASLQSQIDSVKNLVFEVSAEQGAMEERMAEQIEKGWEEMRRVTTARRQQRAKSGEQGKDRG